MALEVYYQTSGTAYAEIGSFVRWGTVGLSESAELGEAAISSLTVDDAAGTATYVGLRKLYVSETAEGTADRVIWHGYVADQTISRGDLGYAGSARQWTLTLVDDNAGLGYRLFSGTAANRPAESGSARLAWALTEGSGYIADDGLVAYPGTGVQMDAVDYRGQYLNSVLSDLANASGYEYFATWNPASSVTRLFFGDATASTAYASSIKISNVGADVDGTAVVAPDMDARLHRDPSRIAGGVYLPYAGGTLYGTAAATIAAFGHRDQVAPSSNVRTASGATAVLTRLLSTMNEQEERVVCRVWLKTSQVNDIRAGHRIQAKFSHFPTWQDYRWCRVVRRTVSNFDSSLGLYELTLELIPQTSNFEGTAGLFLLRSQNRSAQPVFSNTGDSEPAGGWYKEPTVTSYFTATTNGFGEYTGMTVSQNMIVRMNARADYIYVASGSQTVSLNILVNGGNVGTDSDTSTGGLRGVAGTLDVDIRNYQLYAGDSVTVSGARADGGDPGWQNVGANDTYFRVGRGTHVWNSGVTTWDGP